MSNETLRWYLPLFLLVYLLVSFVVPSYRVYKRTGINPVTFGNTDSAHDYIGRMMKMTTGLLVAVVLYFSLSGNAYRYTVPISYLQREWVQLTGLLLIHISLLWIIVAQHQMNNSWRIGIDETNKTTLITRGVFRVSRNPIFLGMISSLAGVFLTLPNAYTLLVFVSSYVLIQIQIRLEEAFLTKEHGEAYRVYRTKVHRLL